MRIPNSVVVALPVLVGSGVVIAGDGNVIAGFGFGPGGLEGWVITLATPCEGDVDESGDVGFDDLLRVLSEWGPCEGCPEDVNGDDVVDFDDLLIVLSNWGTCN